jgi:hypothetical protein
VENTLHQNMKKKTSANHVTIARPVGSISGLVGTGQKKNPRSSQAVGIATARPKPAGDNDYTPTFLFSLYFLNL